MQGRLEQLGGRLAAIVIVLLAGLAPAMAQQPISGAAVDKVADSLMATQDYLERRWLLLQTRMLLQKIKSTDVIETLNADVQRLGLRGPSMAELAVLDGDLAIETEAFVAMIEKRIRSGQFRAAAGQPDYQYANKVLVQLELIRHDLREARAKKRDPWPAMDRAGKLHILVAGGSLMPGFDLFDGRDLTVNLAMEKIRVAPQRPQR